MQANKQIWLLINLNESLSLCGQCQSLSLQFHIVVCTHLKHHCLSDSSLVPVITLSQSFVLWSYYMLQCVFQIILTCLTNMGWDTVSMSAFVQFSSKPFSWSLKELSGQLTLVPSVGVIMGSSQCEESRGIKLVRSLVVHLHVIFSSNLRRRRYQIINGLETHWHHADTLSDLEHRSLLCGCIRTSLCWENFLFFLSLQWTRCCPFILFSDFQTTQVKYCRRTHSVDTTAKSMMKYTLSIYILFSVEGICADRLL